MKVDGIDQQVSLPCSSDTASKRVLKKEQITETDDSSINITD